MPQGGAIADHDTLRAIAASVGLPATEVAETLASDAFTDEVRSDEAEATQLGVRGVPFFAFDRQLAVSGAQSTDTFTRALTEAWTSRSSSPKS